MPNLKGLNLNIDSNQDRLEKTPSWTERLGNKLSVLTPQSVTEPGFVDALTQPTDATRDMSNFSSYMGSGIRRGIVDPLKRYAMAVEKGMTGQALSAADILAITEVNMDVVAGGGFLNRKIDPSKLSSFPAWHGGATSFDKFADHAIGSGEGAQAFGKGHYLTDSKGIANGYAKKLGVINRNHPAQIRNQKLISDWHKSQEVQYKGKNLWFGQKADTPEDWVVGYLFEEAPKTKKEVQEKIASLRKDLINDYDEIESGFFFEEDGAAYGGKEVLDFIDKIDINDFKEPKKLPKPKLEKVPDSQQNLYKTTIMKGKEPDEYDFIDYHKPISEQPNVLEKIKKLDEWDWFNADAAEHNIDLEDATISNFLNAMSAYDLDEDTVIKTLQNAGLPGIVYDAGTIAGGVKPGTKNYVVFNPDDISIDEHYIDGILQKPTD